MMKFSEKGERLRPPEITRLMSLALETPGLLSLAAGFTDTTSLPAGAVAEVVKDLTLRSGPPEHLQYGSNQGRPGLREEVARRLAKADGAGADSVRRDEVIVTTGSQQALALACEVLCDPGDVIFVERPTYFVFLDVARSLGVRLRSIPEDPATGILDSQAFRDLLEGFKESGEEARVKGVYLVSYFSNPSSRSLGTAQKEELADILQESGFVVPVLEDAAYRELHFRDPVEAPSALALQAFRSFPVLYMGTFTKPFATGLKVGFACTNDPEWRDRILHLKGAHDFGTANLNQAVVEEALRTGAFDEQVGRVRTVYRTKMEVLDEALRREGLPELGWTWERPDGGLYLWLRAPDRLDTGLDSEFCARCLEAGVLYVPGELCFGDDPDSSFVRLSFGVLDEDGLQEAARRFAEAARSE